MTPALQTIILPKLAAAAEYREPMDPFAFAEKVFRVPDEHGNGMRFYWDYAPYWREMFEELLNPDNKDVSLQIFSRGGKTMLCLLGKTYFAVERPCKMATMRPSKGNAEDFAKKEVQAGLIDLMPEMLEIFGDGTNRRLRHMTILDKSFPGGHWKILGSNVAGDIRQVQAQVLWGDEIDAIEREKGDEGDPMNRFRKRGNQFPERLIWWSSYPGTYGRSRIQRQLDASDYRKWHVNCTKCGDPWVMDRENDLKYEDANPEGAVLECPKCGAHHGEDARIKLARGGRWIPTQPEIKLKPGFHANSLLWPHAVNRKEYPGGYLQQLAEAEIAAKASEDPEGGRQTIVTMEDANPYRPPQLDTPQPENILSRAEDYNPALAIPAGVLLITLGADLQGDRIECEIVGHGLGFREWGLGYFILTGKPESKELEEKLDQVLAMKFQHPILGEMSIDRGGLDCGFEPDWVKHVCVGRKHQMRAVRGSNNYAASAIEKITTEPFTYAGRTRRCKVYVLNTHYLKKQVYDRLAIHTQDNPSRSMHYPKGNGYDIKYYRGLTLEVPEMRSQKGNDFLFFDDREVKGNEALDTRVYAKGLVPKLMATMRARAKKVADGVEGGGTTPVLPSTVKAGRPTRRRPSGKNFVTDY